MRAWNIGIVILSGLISRGSVAGDRSAVGSERTEGEAFAALTALMEDPASEAADYLELAKRYPENFEPCEIAGQTRKAELATFVEVRGKLVYVRPGSFSGAEAESVGQRLEEVDSGGANALILDLRVSASDRGVREMALWVDLFLPAGADAFRIRAPAGNSAVVRSANSPKWGGEVFLLVDEDTGNVGEVLASVLIRERDALVFGGATPGRGAVFSELEIGGGKALRYVAADVFNDEGQMLRGEPTPLHFRADFEMGAKRVAFEKVSELGLDAVVVERVRPRRNEAALIDGIDPELPFLLARSERERREKGGGGEGEIRDPRIGAVVDDPVIRVVVDVLEAADATDLEEKIEHVKRREWRLEETRRKLEEIRKAEGSEETKPEEERAIPHD